MLSIIVAISEENAIGNAGAMLCHLPDDLKHFKAITSNHAVIMGRRTYLSLPKRPLPNRRNIIITTDTTTIWDGVETVHSLHEALQLLNPADENFIIGGGMVYRQAMPLADKLYITHIHHSFAEADTFFPNIDPNQWQLIGSDSHPADDRHPYPYTFAEYVRK